MDTYSMPTDFTVEQDRRHVVSLKSMLRFTSYQKGTWRETLVKSLHEAFSVQVQVMDCACVSAASLRSCSAAQIRSRTDDSSMQMNTLSM